jgi:hypothetical protein
MTRQRRLDWLIEQYWRAGTRTMTLPPSHPSAASQREGIRIGFEAAEANLAEYVAKNAGRITIRSGK